MIFAALLVLQSQVSDWRPVEIMTTVLLAILGVLSTWVLRTLLAHAKKFGAVQRLHAQEFTELTDSLNRRFGSIDTSLTQMRQQLWGVDGRNGHTSDLRAIKSALRDIDRYLERMHYRMSRVEEKLGLQSGEHEKYRGGRGDDDTEDDRRG